jgi:hypothetical protein
MITQVMVQSSSWIESGIKLSKVRDLNLFKFADGLQARLDELSEHNKSDELTDAEAAELAGILELDRIFTLLNARIMTISDSVRQLVRKRARSLCEYCHSSGDCSLSKEISMPMNHFFKYLKI